ncbi:hypothetical protein TNCV_1877481 [Trichonephila clavipes]|nr:hypothetical protein TNCV_1877481 [Trichonephila clavipes]
MRKSDGYPEGATETSRNITARVIELDISAKIHYFLEDSKLTNMVANNAKMVAKLAPNLVAKNDPSLALPPRICQVLIESPL